MESLKNLGLIAIGVLLVVASHTIAAPASQVYVPHITEPPYAGPRVIELRPPTGYTIIGGADVSSIRLADDSICWAASISFPNKLFSVRVFRQVGNDIAIEQPLDRYVVGRGTLSRDDDGVVLTAVEVERAFRIYVKGCNE